MLTLTKEDIIRDEIISTAQKLFQRYGLDKTTMEDIAKALGKGKSTLYYYYKSKDDIFDAVICKEVKEVFDFIKEEIDKVSSAEEKLITYVNTLIKKTKDKINLYNLLVKEIFESNNNNDKLSKFDKDSLLIVKGILLLGIENGEFNKQLLENNVDILAYVVVSSLRSIIIDLIIGKDEEFSFLENDKIAILGSILIRGLK